MTLSVDRWILIIFYRCFCDFWGFFIPIDTEFENALPFGWIKVSFLATRRFSTIRLERQLKVSYISRISQNFIHFQLSLFQGTLYEKKDLTAFQYLPLLVIALGPRFEKFCFCFLRRTVKNELHYFSKHLLKCLG